MTIDMTAQLMPIVWGLDLAMIVSGVAILIAVLRAELREQQVPRARRPDRPKGRAALAVPAARPARC